MSKRFHGVLAAVLAFVLVLSLLPTAALPAQAAETSSGGYVLFEETFDKDGNGNLKSGNTFTPGYQSNHTIANSQVSFASGSSNQYIDFVLSGLAVPVLSSKRAYVALKVELFVHETSATTRNASIQLLESKDASGATVSYTSIVGETTAIIDNKSGVAIGYPNKKVDSIKVRVGARSGGTGVVVIEGVRISMIVSEIAGQGGVVGQDMGRFLDVQDGFFQLQRDLTFTSYTLASDTSKSATDLIMGSNAVLDLNGHTLTIADGSSLSVPVNAKIVDSSAGKTGKIVCAKDALTIANTDHPTLPVWTGNGYVLTEPKLEADKHIMVVADSQNHDKFTLHLRPGFGTLSNGTVNVREAYLSKGNSGITMSAFITSVDLFGNRYNLQDNGSEEIVLDGMFDGMYASNLARCQIAFEGFEKYQALEITIKLSSDGVVYTLPTYTVENTYVTKHYASQFNYGEADYKIAQGTYSVTEAGKLSYTGGTLGFTLANPINTGAGDKLVIEGDIDFASSGIKMGFEVRGTSVNGNNRYYLFATNQYATQNGYHYVLQKNDVAGEKHIRIEVDLNTFAVVCTVDGVSSTAAGPAVATDLEHFLAAWNNKSVILASANGHSASTPLVYDNLLIYTIKTA